LAEQSACLFDQIHDLFVTDFLAAEGPSSANFPPYGEALFRALLRASMRGELLASASLVGFYSTTPAN
jgi:hypothetical protein